MLGITMVLVGNSSNGRAIETALDKFVFVVLMEDIEIFFVELISESLLGKITCSNKHLPCLGAVANTTKVELLLSIDKNSRFSINLKKKYCYVKREICNKYIRVRFVLSGIMPLNKKVSVALSSTTFDNST